MVHLFYLPFSISAWRLAALGTYSPPVHQLAVAMSQQAHRRRRLHALAIVVAALSSSCRAATTCAEQVKAAVKTVTGDGIGVSCCKPNSADCKLSLIGACDDEYSTWGWCLGAGSSRACAISYGPDADAPCGAYDGPAGPTFGMSPVAKGYTVALQSADIQSALRTNWARLSTLSDAGLCCAAADVLGAAPCHVGKVLLLSENPCNAGEYELKCFGTSTHGLCAAYSNEKNTTEIGQYYFVNFDEHAASPSQSTASPSPSQSTTPSPKKSHSNAAAIAVPVVLVLLLAIGVAAFAIRRRKRRAARAAAHKASLDPFFAPSVAHATGGSPTTAPWPDSSTMHPMTQMGDSSFASHSSADVKLARLHGQSSVAASGAGEPQLPPYSLHPEDQAAFGRR